MTLVPQPAAPQDRPGQAGFTLIEVLIALALAGLISLIAMQGIALATNGVWRLSLKADQGEQRHGMEMRLRRALGSTIAIPVFNGQPSFVGNSAGMSFLSVAEDGRAGLYRVTVAFRSGLAARPVVLSRQLADPAVAAALEEGVLAHDVHAFSLEYFGAAAPGSTPAWQDSWQGLGQPPELVRVIFDDGDGIEHPPIIIRLPNAP
ncbi:MAG: prepilin-type N-terminal cleavage/methylation domain-containing protein [Alphaproteobacteria bacterium]|nr:prepilin-type N-terminal cleavage/methylation domain-containing protein [Alphaproteobacteria bacterium]